MTGPFHRDGSARESPRYLGDRERERERHAELRLAAGLFRACRPGARGAEVVDTAQLRGSVVGAADDAWGRRPGDTPHRVTRCHQAAARAPISAVVSDLRRRARRVRDEIPVLIFGAARRTVAAAAPENQREASAICKSIDESAVA